MNRTTAAEESFELIRKNLTLKSRFETRSDFVNIPDMSATELIQTANALNSEERLFLAAYLKHLGRVDDPKYQEELSRLNQEIDDGKKFSLEQVKRLHESLKAEGL